MPPQRQSAKEIMTNGTGLRISTSVGGMLTRLWGRSSLLFHRLTIVANSVYPLIEAGHFQCSKNALVV